MLRSKSNVWLFVVATLVSLRHRIVLFFLSCRIFQIVRLLRILHETKRTWKVIHFRFIHDSVAFAQRSIFDSTKHELIHSRHFTVPQMQSSISTGKLVFECWWTLAVGVVFSSLIFSTAQIQQTRKQPSYCWLSSFQITSSTTQNHCRRTWDKIQNR